MRRRNPIVEALKPFAVQELADIAGVTPRTAENWKRGDNGPSWNTLVRLLNDARVAPQILTAMGRPDLAGYARIMTALKQTSEAIAKAFEEFKARAEAESITKRNRP